MPLIITINCADCQSSSGVSVDCCPNLLLPETLHVTVANSGSCGIDGTYGLTYNNGLWTGTVGGYSATFGCTNTSNPPCGGFHLLIGGEAGGLAYTVYEVKALFPLPGEGYWVSCDCTTPSWVSSATSPSPSQFNPCPHGGNATFTVTA